MSIEPGELLDEDIDRAILMMVKRYGPNATDEQMADVLKEVAIERCKRDFATLASRNLLRPAMDIGGGVDD